MKRFLVGLLMAIPVLSFAQSNFQKGYLVTNNQDTIKGYVDYKERSANPSSFNFRTDLNNEIKVYGVKECSAYGIDGIESSQRYVVRISQSRMTLNDLSTGLDTSSKTDTVFLKVLQTGKNITLFSYEDNIKRRFFIRESGMSEPYELIQSFFLAPNKTGVFVTDNKYVRQLKEVTEKFGMDISEEKLKYYRYSGADLIKLSSRINGDAAVKSTYKLTRFYAGGGLSISKVSFQGQNDLASKAAINNSSAMPSFQAGIDLFLNPAIRRFIFRTELSFFSSKNKVSLNEPINEYISDQSQAFDQLSLCLTPQFIYNFYNTSALKVFLGAGLGCNFSKYSNVISSMYNSLRKEFDIQKDTFKPEKFNFSFPISAGVVLNKKIEVSAMYSMPTSITTYTMFSASMQRWKFGVNYLFGKN
ncbi:outer membrane beta-barrel protein [Pedobacter nutrimenti]|uniref:outer membrane beta-barrel protein n=1 Tax=Pedobacter nutrimenti TaxID=1241337 RepID=UPI00292E47D5|nr:outer membrane beta-barrel protein [Pedobacter nutrimenti]